MAVPEDKLPDIAAAASASNCPNCFAREDGDIWEISDRPFPREEVPAVLEEDVR